MDPGGPYFRKTLSLFSQTLRLWKLSLKLTNTICVIMTQFKWVFLHFLPYRIFQKQGPIGQTGWGMILALYGSNIICLISHDNKLNCICLHEIKSYLCHYQGITHYSKITRSFILRKQLNKIHNGWPLLTILGVYIFLMNQLMFYLLVWYEGIYIMATTGDRHNNSVIM